MPLSLFLCDPAVFSAGFVLFFVFFIIIFFRNALVLSSKKKLINNGYFELEQTKIDGKSWHIKKNKLTRDKKVNLCLNVICCHYLLSFSI